MSILEIFLMLLLITTVAHRKEFSGACRVQYRSNFANITDYSLERVLLLYQAPSTTRNVLIILSIFSLQIQARAPQAQIVIARENQDIIRELSTLCAAHHISDFIFGGIHVQALIFHHKWSN